MPLKHALTAVIEDSWGTLEKEAALQLIHSYGYIRRHENESSHGSSSELASGFDIGSRTSFDIFGASTNLTRPPAEEVTLRMINVGQGTTGVLPWSLRSTGFTVLAPVPSITGVFSCTVFHISKIAAEASDVIVVSWWLGNRDAYVSRNAL